MPGVWVGTVELLADDGAVLGRARARLTRDPAGRWEGVLTQHPGASVLSLRITAGECTLRLALTERRGRVQYQLQFHAAGVEIRVTGQGSAPF